MCVYTGDDVEDVKGDTRSLDYSSLGGSEKLTYVVNAGDHCGYEMAYRVCR